MGRQGEFSPYLAGKRGIDGAEGQILPMAGLVDEWIVGEQRRAAANYPTIH
jgi:hypothetical protein